MEILMKFAPEEIAQVQAYLSRKLANGDIALRPREKAEDSVEVLIKGEFIGTIYKDVDEGETSYTFTMSILDIDLSEAA